MGVKDLIDDDGAEYEKNPEGEQKKSLIGHTYSNTGASDPDPYQDCTDWEDFDRLAYEVTKDGGLLRVTAKKLAASGSHHEWYSNLQIALAHYVADLLGRDLPGGREAEGAPFLMDFLDFDGGDIMDYLRQHPEYIDQLESEELKELHDEWVEEQEEEDDEETAEAAEADD